MFKYKFIIWLHSHLSQETNIENKLESLLESLDTFPKDLLRHADIYTTFISDEQIAASEALSKILKSKNITNGNNLIEKLKNNSLNEYLPDFVIGDDEQIFQNYGIPTIQNWSQHQAQTLTTTK